MWPSWAADPQLRRRGLLLHGGGLQRRDTDGRPLHRGRRVVVVGGGLSAAQLARGAVEDGAHVTVLARRPIVRRRMDVDPRWLGPTLMGPFAAAAPARRRRMLDDARGGGSMPVWAERELRHLHRGGRLNLREGVGVDLLVPVDDGVAVCTRDGVAVADQIWLATGSIPDVGADPALADLAARCPVALHDGLPELRADLGWATTAVHVAGALAGLQVGPIAGNLAGHRQAAERIVAAWA
jgi:cation diffusion facilitator CzcD-associated flavoprotein CzcO